MFDTLTRLSAEGWTAVGTLALATATTILVGVGIRQLFSIRAEAKKERTLAICHRYDIDPTLDASLRRLWELQVTPTSAPTDLRKYHPDIATVLNYLDSIAVGIEQELYIEELARDHIESIVKKHVEQYLHGDRPQLAAINADNYKSLTRLCERWSSDSVRYRDGSRKPRIFGRPIR